MCPQGMCLWRIHANPTDFVITVGGFFGDSNPRQVLEDVYDGLYQLAHNSELAGAFSLTVISIGKKTTAFYVGGCVQVLHFLFYTPIINPALAFLFFPSFFQFCWNLCYEGNVSNNAYGS